MIPAVWPLSLGGGCSKEGKKDIISGRNHPRKHKHTVSIL